MTDLLGPASAHNAVTTRPTDTRVFGPDDTWMKDCTSPSQEDGTRIEAAFLNGMLAQLRAAIRGMGITVDNEDDEMLLKCFLAVGASIDAVTRSQARANLRIFPEVLTPDGKVTITNSTGQIVVGGMDVFIWRGVFRIDLATFTAGNRTFATSANKVYHLRWHASGTGLAMPADAWPNGRFVLRDLADAAYNPGGLLETNSAFDTTFDDVLLARVETNPANTPTVTRLVNLAVLHDIRVLDGTRITGPSGDGTRYTFATTLDWSRTPKFLNSVRKIADPNSGGVRRDEDVETVTVTRYGMTAQMLMDYSTNYSINALFLAR